MNFTLFGYPKTGKSTLFSLLTGRGTSAQDYDSGKKEANQRNCVIPDERLDKIAELYPDKKKKYTTIDSVDLAGISFGDVKNEFYLNYLRKANGLTHVVRAFENPLVPHPKGKIDPQNDIQAMETEIVLADLMSIESRLLSLEKELARTKNPEGEKEGELLKILQQHLEEGRSIRELDLSPAEEKIIRSFAFLSEKPLFHMINIDEHDMSSIENPELIFPLQKKGTKILAFCGSIEREIRELEEEEKKIFMEEYGLKELSVRRFLKASYDLLQVITFFTVGKQEVKAWTLKKNTPALLAAGAIHSDIEKGFIRAEVISCDDLLEHGSFQSAKEKAAIRLEGKDYPVQNGDVIYFRFSK